MKKKIIILILIFFFTFRTIKPMEMEQTNFKNKSKPSWLNYCKKLILSITSKNESNNNEVTNNIEQYSFWLELPNDIWKEIFLYLIDFKQLKSTDNSTDFKNSMIEFIKLNLICKKFKNIVQILNDKKYSEFDNKTLKELFLLKKRELDFFNIKEIILKHKDSIWDYELAWLEEIDPTNNFDLNNKTNGNKLLDIATSPAVKEKDFTSIINILLKNNYADINNKFGHESLLTLLSEGNDINKIKILLENGADPNIANYGGNTALMKVISNTYRIKEKNSKKIISLLLKHNANPNIKNEFGDTPLHWAVINGYKEIAEILLKFGADPNIKNNRDKTALNYINESIQVNNNLFKDIPFP